MTLLKYGQSAIFFHFTVIVFDFFPFYDILCIIEGEVMSCGFIGLEEIGLKKSVGLTDH